MGIIKADDLVFDYIRRDEEGNVENVTEAVDHVSLDVEQGQFIAILGHNGSGKSTLAKHINAILKPTEGEMTVDGMSTSEEDNVWSVRQTAGMVFQNPDNQIVATIVEEDVAFGPENLGVPTDEIWERVNKALESVNMTMYRGYSPNKLSGGQKQRVAIAGVLAMKPKCIVLDEATAMLDPLGRKEVMSAIIELNKVEKITVILITHYMDEAVLADKIFVMDKGKIAMEGTPRQVFSHVEEIRKLRLDVPAATAMAYELRKAGYNVPKDILTRDELVEAVCQLY
ncbi:energy-coupling factor transporter ATPase [Eshraghiella crossota]|uniref:ABC transporter, ATP-binding protein n=1 Tax=Eshraghiella crossota DSM 2876 TaxID=511680 RepID=D4RZH3_9FIRM|nr:energy-coupling factor transporter ATPase [Butyrivibrio crossotus]EFF68581.1 ABC transporter, ATP-binding protein [Butyrivibrio crossotus DSM 2876]UWO50372.1 energy-coupling factor transporter ATPase [Butyrivibrio crossotus]